jgi:hypothetical protein
MDAMGQGFVEESRTLLLSRHGAKILLRHMLVPEQEISIRYLATTKEADVRVVGQIGGGSEGQYYGVEFLDPNINLWDIEFPPLSESEKAVARVLIECVRCHTRVLSYLNEFEAEVFEANQILSRSCARCTDMSLWKLATVEAPSAQVTLPLPDPGKRTQNERKEVRVGLHMKACIRTAHSGEEIVVTENVSRGGFSFKSRQRYGEGNVVEVSVPYSPGGANIFSPARIEYPEEEQAEGPTSYGVAYIPVHKGWPGS